MIDADSSYGVSVDELYSAFMEMQVQVSRSQTEQVFNSIDFDNSGTISIGELISSYRDTIMSDEDVLVQRN